MVHIQQGYGDCPARIWCISSKNMVTARQGYWKAVVADEVDGNTSGSDENGFGDPDNNDSGAFVTFNGALYVAIENKTTGGQIWRSADGATWLQVVDDGFGDIGNEKMESRVVFNNRLHPHPR